MASHSSRHTTSRMSAKPGSTSATTTTDNDSPRYALSCALQAHRLRAARAHRPARPVDTPGFTVTNTKPASAAPYWNRTHSGRLGAQIATRSPRLETRRQPPRDRLSLNQDLRVGPPPAVGRIRLAVHQNRRSVSVLLHQPQQRRSKSPIDHVLVQRCSVGRRSIRDREPVRTLRDCHRSRHTSPVKDLPRPTNSATGGGAGVTVYSSKVSIPARCLFQPSAVGSLDAPAAFGVTPHVVAAGGLQPVVPPAEQSGVSLIGHTRQLIGTTRVVGLEVIDLTVAVGDPTPAPPAVRRGNTCRDRSRTCEQPLGPPPCR